jgi:CheY-like chemotaxis protein
MQMKKKVLIIDDDKTVRKAFQLSLEDLDCETVVAETGEMGVKKFKQDNIGLIFLDLRMPGMTGLEALLAIRAIDKDVPIYIITAFYKEYFLGLKKIAKEGISFDLLNKPVSSDEILMIAKNTIGKCEQ